jgi:hypothetical protein
MEYGRIDGRDSQTRVVVASFVYFRRGAAEGEVANSKLSAVESPEYLYDFLSAFRHFRLPS